MPKNLGIQIPLKVIPTFFAKQSYSNLDPSNLNIRSESKKKISYDGISLSPNIQLHKDEFRHTQSACGVQLGC